MDAAALGGAFLGHSPERRANEMGRRRSGEGADDPAGFDLGKEICGDGLAVVEESR
jgi:hypothetical protein